MAELEVCSLLDLVICHMMQKLIELTYDLVLDDEATVRKKRKYKMKRDDAYDGVPVVRVGRGREA